MLEGLIIARIAQAPMHRLHRLPLAVAEQPVDVPGGRVALRLAAETRTELIEELAESSQECPRGASRHACSVPNAVRQYKRNHSAQNRQPDKVVLTGFAAQHS